MVIVWHTLLALVLSLFQKKSIGNGNMITDISRIQAHDSIMCGYICIGFLDFMFKEKL